MARAEAQRKHRKLFEGGSCQSVVEGARRYRAYCDASGKTGTEFVAQMTTWLNQRRWLEDYELPAPPALPGSDPDQREPCEGRDYVLRPFEGGVRPMDKAQPGTPFDASAWFSKRRLSPTSKWARYIETVAVAS